MSDVVQGLLILWAASGGWLMVAAAFFAARRRDYGEAIAWLTAGAGVLLVAWRTGMAM